MLYLYPSAPQIKDNQLVVPLLPFAELMGMNVSYDPQTLNASVSHLGQSLQIELGSKVAIMEGQAIDLRLPPYLLSPYGTLMIPLAPLLDAFDIPWNWSVGTDLFTLEAGPTPEKQPKDSFSPTIKDYRHQFKASFALADLQPESQAALPTFFKWRWKDEGIFQGKVQPAYIQPKGSKLSIVLEPGSPEEISEEVGVSFLLIPFGFLVQPFGDGLSPMPGERPANSCEWTSARVVCSQTVDSMGNPVQFLLARVWQYDP